MSLVILAPPPAPARVLFSDISVYFAQNSSQILHSLEPHPLQLVSVPLQIMVLRTNTANTAAMTQSGQSAGQASLPILYTL